jgi:hypothetical protein
MGSVSGSVSVVRPRPDAEFVFHAFNAYRRNGSAFDRTQERAAAVANGGAEAALERLRVNMPYRSVSVSAYD